MFGDMSGFKILRKNGSRSIQSEENENELENPLNLAAFPPSRAPLNTIQNLTQSPLQQADSGTQFGENRFSDLPPLNKGIGVGNSASNYATPRTVRAKTQSEPNSAQSTPTRSLFRVCNNGSSSAFTGGRPPQSSVSRGSSHSRVSRAISHAAASPSMEVPHFELAEDPSFWKDHNVQVLIRIRPISISEMALQGYARCLKQETPQTLTWLGNPETRFTFDHVASEIVTQEMLFKVAGLPMVENCMSGYNSCMFAYGQTGSGKTYTMMGEIYGEMDNKFGEDCGMTPRVFEYLFARIRSEEENRRDEKLKYGCKCSFLEIYNEQITDLLEPSSTNLQLREDAKKGVYVENLTEYEVRTVKDVLGLLFQGAANRKMAATNMNSESSRSHSVFTCVIESRWEKDAMTHLRFGRLNLVDLAGSERQKSSGAEGERLKEAANINKSLSTLGLVIMTLVDVAHGKQRHVPYRDSRLTFLLQDSLGGNSKTTIIANISPSICCANETLSTLKFAQRAKLIQNNAKVNEDASGDVLTLQRQIQQLRDQLTYLLQHQNASTSLSSRAPILEHRKAGAAQEEYDFLPERNFSSALLDIPAHKLTAFNIPRVSNKKMKYLEATLVGALRREKVAENELRRLEAQIEHMNRLIHQREEDNQRTRVMLRFQEEKIRRLELLTNGLLSGDEYLVEENSALSKQIPLLRAKIDRNPELTRFALENIRLLEQLRMFQDFYEEGERDILLAEVSELRDQLFEALKEKSCPVKCPSRTRNQDRIEVDLGDASAVQEKVPLHTKVDDTLKELEDCKQKLGASLETNARLTREIADLRNQLNRYLNCKEVAFHTVDDSLYVDAAMIAEADHDQLLRKHSQSLGQQNDGQGMDCVGTRELSMQERLEGRTWMPEKARKLCTSSESHRALPPLEEKEQVHKQVEGNRAETVLYMDKQLPELQQEIDLSNEVELRDRLYHVSQENTGLVKALTDRDEEIHAFTAFIETMEKGMTSLTSFLEDGSDQPEPLTNLFPERSAWVHGELENAVKFLIQKENIIADLQKKLENAQKMGLDMKMKLRSLRGATLAITEVQQLENNERFQEVIQLRMLLSEKISIIHELENKIRHREDQVLEADKASSEFLINEPAVANSHGNESHQSLESEFAEAELHVHPVESDESQPQGKEAYQSHEVGIDCPQLEVDCNGERFELAMVEMSRMLETFEQRMGEAEAGCHKTREMLCLKLSDMRVVAAEKSNQANTLLMKFEEAQEIIREADLMLNELLKANESAKQETDRWKQVGQELLVEKAMLIEEVQRLKTSICLKEQQSEFVDSISSLKESLVQTQCDLDEKFKVVYLDIFSFGQELLDFISTSRSWLEDIWFEMIEKDFALFVVHQCHIGFLEKRVSSKTYIFQARSSELEIDHAMNLENLLLKKELARKDVLLKGLLFDFSLLQESTSNAKDIKDETEEMMTSLMQVQHELVVKTTQLDDIFVQHRRLEAELADKKAALSASQSGFEQAKKTLELAFKENVELRTLLEDLYYKSANAEKQLEEKQKVVEDLEKEILRMASSAEQNILSSTEDVGDALRRLNKERDGLCAEVSSLNDQLEMAHAVADENEAVAVEARQVSEASKIYAEQKEEEARILERSVEELECTINVLETKVNEMGEEVDRQRSMREDLELELQALRPRMLTIQNATGHLDTDSLSVEEGSEDQISRFLDNERCELREAKKRIQILEKERSDQAEKIKQREEYISELVLHSEAQAAQYHQKYTALEALVREAQTEPSTSNFTAATVARTEKSSTRTRGSGSPFKCIAGLVQQMISEKDQQLSVARLRIEELEALAACRQKEVCMLSTRLAAAESMTHDVIRDLLGVKLDMTNYANLIDQQQVQKLAEKAQQLSEESCEKELEILELKEQMRGLIDERECWIEEINQRKTDTLAAQVAVEQLQQRDQLLSAQNEMLKMDKENLMRKVVELDEMVKKLFQSHNLDQRFHHHTKIKESTSSRVRNDGLTKRLGPSRNFISHVNDELMWYRKRDGKDPDIDSSDEQRLRSKLKVAEESCS